MNIALCGCSGVGKDYLANKLVVQKGYKRIAFADSLKEYCNHKYKNLAEYDIPEKKDTVVQEPWNINKETARQIWIRESVQKSQQDDRFFHNITLKKIKDLKNTKSTKSTKGTKNTKIVVTDVRNKWEYLDLCDLGFTIIYITREGKELFQGYDNRIKEFYKEIRYKYKNDTNDTDGLGFIKMINALEDQRG